MAIEHAPINRVSAVAQVDGCKIIEDWLGKNSEHIKSLWYLMSIMSD